MTILDLIPSRHRVKDLTAELAKAHDELIAERTGRILYQDVAEHALQRCESYRSRLSRKPKARVSVQEKTEQLRKELGRG